MLNHLAIELAYARARVRMIGPRDAIHESELPGCCEWPCCPDCGAEVDHDGTCSTCQPKRDEFTTNGGDRRR